MNTPTLAQFKAVGYIVEITHNRDFKVVFIDPATTKIVVNTVTTTFGRLHEEEPTLSELLPCGGRTEVSVVCPDTGLEFTASSKVHPKDNYNKREGVRRCLERIYQLMLVCEYRDSKEFKTRFPMESIAA